MVATAEVAAVAGSGVHGENAVAEGEFCYSGTDFDDGAGEFVAEDDGRLQHHGVVAAAIDLEVGAAGEGCADPDQEFAVSGMRDRDLLHAQVFAAVQHCRQHGFGRRFHHHASIFSLSADLGTGLRTARDTDAR